MFRILHFLKIYSKNKIFKSYFKTTKVRLLCKLLFKLVLFIFGPKFLSRFRFVKVWKKGITCMLKEDMVILTWNRKCAWIVRKWNWCHIKIKSIGGEDFVDISTENVQDLSLKKEVDEFNGNGIRSKSNRFWGQ